MHKFLIIINFYIQIKLYKSKLSVDSLITENLQFHVILDNYHGVLIIK